MHSTTRLRAWPSTFKSAARSTLTLAREAQLHLRRPALPLFRSPAMGPVDWRAHWSLAAPVARARLAATLAHLRLLLIRRLPQTIRAVLLDQSYGWMVRLTAMGKT